MAVQLTLVFFAQKSVVINVDGIFSYTLSNNPYVYVFIDDIYKDFPENNGWIDAHILKENYATEEYDRFNYAAAYYHQRYDVHPPLYYFAVHTVSSLFPGTYSNLFTMSINLAALLLTDIIMIRLFRLLYGNSGYGLAPIAFLMSMDCMKFLFLWARMYMMLFLFCTWYLYIHAKLLQRSWRKVDLLQLALCVFFGTLTHYYFYVYAGALTLLAILVLLRGRKVRALLSYLYFGIAGIAVSWICYPWVLFHIFGNTQSKHTDIARWSLERVNEYLTFLGDALSDGGAWGWALLLVIWCAGVLLARREKEEERENWRQVFRWLAMGSGLMYSLVIYTLDGGNRYYMTAFYMALIVWASMALIDLCRRLRIPGRMEYAVRIGMALIGVWLICSGSVVSGYLSNAGRVVRCMSEGTPLVDEFRQTPQKYQNYNCLYIEKKQDNLFHNYWFEFGQYRQFKKLPLEQFALYGIREEDLQGCEQGGDGIVVYAPKECSLDQRDYRRIAADDSYVIYRYVGGENG